MELHGHSHPIRQLDTPTQFDNMMQPKWISVRQLALAASPEKNDVGRMACGRGLCRVTWENRCGYAELREVAAVMMMQSQEEVDECREGGWLNRTGDIEQR